MEVGEAQAAINEDTESASDESFDDEARTFNLLHTGDADRMVKRTEKEEALQAAARSLIFEYGFDLSELERGFTITIKTISEATGKTKARRVKLDLAAFRSGEPHLEGTVVRAGMIAAKGAKPDDDRNGIAALDEVLHSLPQCEYGFWTNGTELAFRRKIVEGTMARCEDIGEMPAAGEDLSSLENQVGRRRLVAATSETLAQAFHRCHDYIHGNQGLSKSQAFSAFQRLIFCKMYDEEREAQGRRRRFWVGLTERFTPEGQQAIKERLEQLFDEVKGNGSVHSPYAGYFSRDEKIGLHPPVLAYVAGELARYEMLASSEDAKGAAYEEIIDRKQKGDRGQFFTPRNVIRLIVEMLDPGEEDFILDPACGTGGFLVATFRHVRAKIEARLRATWANAAPTPEEEQALREAERAWATEHLWGFDFDADLVKTTRMNLAINGGEGQVFEIDSLKFPEGQAGDLARLTAKIARPYGQPTPVGNMGTFTLVFTNPPFGSKIPFTDKTALLRYDLARQEGKNGAMTRKKSVAPEVLFVERCVQWLRPGGRLGIVLPDGILGNPKDTTIRRWILDGCDVLASVDLPVETFLPQVGVQPSLLFLQKKTDADKDAAAMHARADRPVFMAIVDRVGKDRRGNLIYKRNPDGTDAPPVRRVETRTAYRDGRIVPVAIPIEEPLVDDELPEVLAAWKRFACGEVA